MAILALVSKKPRSGTKILDALSVYEEIGLSDGTIYPLLNRLEREGRISGVWAAPTGGGRGQKIYTISKTGKDALDEMAEAWTGFRDQLTMIIGDTNE
ncbi:MAG: PadR family transcriptional regulator [Pseudomonadota bacterium]